jgi:thiol-disulfide isomerase/thioredoxin
MKFKQEYEALNGTDTGFGQNYVSLSVEEDNPVVYASFEDVMNTLDGTGVILFGFPSCPWCRMAIPVLLEACNQENISKVLYFNASDLRDNKELDENNQVITTKEADPKYVTLMEKLYDHAEVYEGLNDETIKRLYFPTVIVVNKGEIILYHTSTVTSQTDPYKAMTTEQYDELLNIYRSALSELVKGCSINEQRC